MKLLIGEVSKIFAISTDTLRYYDKIGILKSKINPSNNYRYYHLQDLEKLGLIIGIKDLGVPLADIKETMENENLAGYKELLESQKVAITNKIEELKILREKLEDSTKAINEVTEFKNKYNFEMFEIFYKKFNIYSVDFKNVLSSAFILNNDKKINNEFDILNFEDYIYIYNAEDKSNVIEEEKVFVIENMRTKKLFNNKLKTTEIKFEKIEVESKFISVDFYGTEEEMKKYVLLLNEYFNKGQVSKIFVRFKFYLPREKANKYFMNIELILNKN
ncbi:MAG: MerR family transcriptional regulator [Sarcina sp.]